MEEEGIIRCICGYDHDDGFTIQCEKCFVWQHAACLGIRKDRVPDEYFCDLCQPRVLDYELAREIQRRRQPKKSLAIKKRPVVSGQDSPLRRTKPSITSGAEASAQQTSANATLHVAPIVENESCSDDEELLAAADDYIPIAKLIIRDRKLVDQIYSAVDLSNVKNLIQANSSSECSGAKDIHVSVKSVGRTRSSLKLGLFSDVPICSSVIIGEIRGEVIRKGDYIGRQVTPLSDTDLEIPDQYVFLHESFDLSVDSRRYGNEFRFIRYSCRPNASLHSALIVDQDSKNVDFHLCIVSARQIDNGEEITIPFPEEFMGSEKLAIECGCKDYDSCLYNPRGGNHVGAGKEEFTYDIPDAAQEYFNNSAESVPHIFDSDDNASSRGSCEEADQDKLDEQAQLSIDERKLRNELEKFTKVDVILNGLNEGTSNNVELKNQTGYELIESVITPPDTDSVRDFYQRSPLLSPKFMKKIWLSKFSEDRANVVPDRGTNNQNEQTINSPLSETLSSDMRYSIKHNLDSVYEDNENVMQNQITKISLKDYRKKRKVHEEST